MKQSIPLAVGALLLLHPWQGHAQERPTRADLMTQSARNFLATLGNEQKALAVRPIDDAPARTSWHYLPEDLTVRAGIALAQLTPEQRTAAHTMFAAALSSQGYGKLTHIMWLETLLRAIEGTALNAGKVSGEALKRQQSRLRSRDPGKYWIAVFGEPGSQNWGWTFSGHHFAANFTVVGGKVAFTPLFVGANPQTVMSGEHAGERTLQHEIDKAFRLVRSLAPKQRKAAVLSSDVPLSIVADKGRRGAVKAFEGVRADQLDAHQQALLMSLVDEFIGNTSEEIAAAQKASVASDGLAALRFAWWGQTADDNRRFMYRIHGPSILIELVKERNSDGSAANHVHAIVRDPRNDYGEAWLRRHYEEHHQPQP